MARLYDSFIFSWYYQTDSAASSLPILDFFQRAPMEQKIVQETETHT